MQVRQIAFRKQSNHHKRQAERSKRQRPGRQPIEQISGSNPSNYRKQPCQCSKSRGGTKGKPVTLAVSFSGNDSLTPVSATTKLILK